MSTNGRSTIRLAGALSMLLSVMAACAQPPEGSSVSDHESEAGSRTEPASSGAVSLRLALFNVKELTLAKLETTGEPDGEDGAQLRAAAEIIARIEPDILVLQEIDAGEPPEVAAAAFRDRFLRPLDGDLAYRHVFATTSNTGELSGLDLNADGRAARPEERGTREYGEDSFGFGLYPGQYAMAVLSKHPFSLDALRTFRKFLWRDLPGNHLPTDFYDEEEQATLRLSSKSHWDLPIDVGAGRPLHLWVSHPTPPAFDGDEDRNGRRNFDEIKFWAAYADGESALYDDAGRAGGYGSDDPFVVIGDLNARPNGEADYEARTAISQLLDHPRIQDPAAAGHPCASRGPLQGRDPGPPDHPERATASFLGGAQVDWILPSTGLRIRECGVFWPDEEEDAEGARLAAAASDHHLVWIDLVVPADDD